MPRCLLMMLILLGLSFAFAGCGGDDDPITDGDSSDGDSEMADTEKVCEPLQVRSCICPNGEESQQKCNSFGTGWGECENCLSGDSDATDGDSIDGDKMDGDVADGDTTDGDVADGDSTDGDTADGDTIVDGDQADGDDDVIDGDMEFPTPICKTPEALGDGPFFTDITDEIGLGADGLALIGNRIASADFDGDGYPDLLVHTVNSNARDNLLSDPQVIRKHLLLNRPDPSKSDGGRMFVDVTNSSGFTATRDNSLGRSSQFAIFADVDNNGSLDAFSGTYVDANNPQTDPGDRSEILLNDGEANFAFAEASDTTPGAADLWSTTGASFVDVNRDGILDLWVGFWYINYGFLGALQNRLYIGNGDGTFTDQTDAYGLTTDYNYDAGTNHKPSYGVTVCDVDDDGDPDLIGSSYGRQFNELWWNKGDSFEDVGVSSGFASDENEDYTDNEFYKCYCTLHTCDPATSQPRIQCPSPADGYWNSSDAKSWRLGGNTFSTICGDWTGDGLPDLFNAEIQHWHIGQSSDPSQLLTNWSTQDSILFTRPGREYTGLNRTHIGVDWNEGDITPARFDFDLDGYPDLYIASSDYPNTFGLLYHQTSDSHFEDVSDLSGVKHARALGIVASDFDRDGDLDLIIGSSTMRESPYSTPEVHYFRNDVGQNSNAIRLTLKGKGEGFANASAIGARVKVRTGDRVQTEWIQAGYGHFGMQSELPLTIGLGEACVIDELEIRWPNSELSTQSWQDVPANYHLTIREGREPSFAPLAK